MQCPKCQHENPDTQKFCGECGCDLKKVKDIPSKRFTHPQSYTPKFLVEKILAHKSAIEGERKQVTVFFADVAGFTSFSEKLDPEQVHQIMDGAFRIMMNEIHESEGTINQFTGDGVMALFGAPVAHEDHAQRACYAALAIQKAMVEYSEGVKRDFGVNFKMRAGLNTGPVVVGSIGDDLKMDYTAVGDTVNLASRMESAARSGTILVSRNTYKRADKNFKFNPLGMVKVKGKEAPLNVYELVDTIERPKYGLDRQILSEMVGREKELNKLEIQVLKAVNGEGSVVSIIGEAGIGKSRLIAELKNRTIMKQVTLLEGRAISMGRNLSFHPIIDLLKQWARIIEADSEAAALSKLETAIRRVYPEEIQEVLPFVATLMGMKLSGKYAERVKGIEGEALEKLILKNVRELLIKATELSPLVIVIEDLHWADLSSVELMESLLRLADKKRILFVNVFRPGYKETSDRIVETIKVKLLVYYVEIVLQPLDESMSEMLINNMLNIRGLQLSVIDQIVERSGGNPFFIEEVVRSFIDEGAVVAKDGSFEVTEKIKAMVIPHTINDVLMARIDRLEDKTRDLVKVASVIGRSFFYRILTEVEQTVEDIDNRLSYLKEIQLIRDRQRMEELEYLFKHALAQEAAYESILLKKRKELHINVAESIEKVFKEKLHEFYGMLAYHYSKGEDIDKAEEYMIKAGEEAMRSSASREALHYYQEALSLYLNKYGDTADPEKLKILEKNIAIAFFNKGEYENALPYFDRVLERCGIKPPQNKVCVWIKLLFDLIAVILHLYLPSMKSNKIPDHKDNEIFDLSYKRGQTLTYVNALRNFTEGIGIIRKLFGFDLKKIENGYVWLVAGSGLFSYTGFSFRLSNRFLEYAEKTIDKENFKELFAFIFYKLVYSIFSGKWDDIQGHDESILDQNLGIGQFWEVATYINWYFYKKVERGEFKAVYPLIQKLSTMADSYDYELARAHQLRSESHLLIQARKLDDAQRSAEKLDFSAAKMGSDLYRISSFGIKAQIQILLKDLSGAEKSLNQAEEYYKKHEIVPSMYSSFYLRKRFSLDIILLEESFRSNNKSAIAKYRQNAGKSKKNALKNSKKYAPFRTAVFRSTGLYYWLINKQNRAVKWWQKAIAESKRLGTRPDLARTYMEIGKRLLEEKSKFKELDGISAIEYLKKAREMFQEMDLQWDLDELEKIVSDS
ncbi:adenylate/guanylate cyclase domain-containing protein [Thermodesulfobacteriota bacterium]